MELWDYCRNLAKIGVHPKEIKNQDIKQLLKNYGSLYILIINLVLVCFYNHARYIL